MAFLNQTKPTYENLQDARSHRVLLFKDDKRLFVIENPKSLTLENVFVVIHCVQVLNETKGL
jgi:hypothetical protein